MMPRSDEAITVSTSAPTLKLEARAICIGADILVVLQGGSQPHIGAVAAAQPRPSLADAQRISASCSVLTYPGHKEDTVVKRVSEQLSAVLNTRVVVTAGMHWDGLSGTDLQIIDERVGDIICQLTEKLTTQERDP